MRARVLARRVLHRSRPTRLAATEKNRGVRAMRDQSVPPAGNNDGHSQRNRTRGAIRTHLGRKRTGPRTRFKDEGPDRNGRMSGPERHRQEDLFDRLSGVFEEAFAQAGERSVEALESAL